MFPYLEPLERLTREEESKHIRIAQDGDTARALLNSACSMSECDREWLRHIERAGNDAVAALLNDLSQTIEAISRKWHRKSDNRWTIDDCIQAANMGVMIAIEKFETERELRLITYASHWIRSSFGRMRRQGDVVRGNRRTASLDKPMHSDRSSTTMVTYVESRGDSVLREVERREAIDRVSTLLKVLTQRDRDILLMRQSMTLDEVASQFGIGSERVRQIESRALHRVKVEAFRRGFTDDGGRERTTAKIFECPRCQGSNTRTVKQDLKKWYCRDCCRPFTPEELRKN